MPTYVYRREDGTTFEVFQRISDDALTTDPETGQAVERVIGGGAGLIFKGTGFYETDYVRKSSGSSGNGDSKGTSSDAGSASDASPKTDSSSKPETTSTKSSD